MEWMHSDKNQENEIISDRVEEGESCHLIEWC